MLTVGNDDTNGGITESLVDNGRGKVDGQEDALRGCGGNSCSGIGGLYQLKEVPIGSVVKKRVNMKKTDKLRT